ncbi:MAG: hypothetical protein VB958_02340 [Thalassolituus sp.]|uniref:hypothetical protein n=1 Tax=Thalassolituus sp. TaxID=2030822 RepID=UPI003981EF05
MKFIKLTIMVFACAYLWGCASGAKMENMVFHGDQKEYVAEIEQNMSLGEVSGGKKTNPAWASEIDNELFSGATRLRLANEGSAMKNIEGLLEKLTELDIKASQVSLKN